MIDLLHEYDSKFHRRISFVCTAILLLVFIPAQQRLNLLLQPEEAMAQQTLGQVTNQKIPVAGSNFTNYTNPKYGFSLLYPIEWVNEEIDPGLNLTFLMTFDPPPSEFGEFVFFYIAVKNLTNNTSLKQFTDQEIGMLKRPPAATSPMPRGSSASTGAPSSASCRSIHRPAERNPLSGSFRPSALPG